MELFKVPIKNVYYMLSYAWNVVDYSSYKDLGYEYFDNIYNLLASILLKEVNILLKRGFHREYVEQEEITSKLHVQININASLTTQSTRSLKMVCNYDEYSSDVLFNQIIKATLLNFLKCPTLDKDLQIQIRKILLSFNDISLIDIEKKHFSMLRFDRNNMNYIVILNVCRLFNFGLISTMKDGKNKFANFISEDQMQTVYEKFILNFYKKELDSSKYVVHSTSIQWQLNNEYDYYDDLFDVEENPGNRRTDIVIENKEKNIQFIIDAKYYKETLVKKYYSKDELTYRTSHLNQVRGYLLDSEFEGEKIGALLYPALNSELIRGKIIKLDTPIIIKTLDLNSEWLNIKEDMLDFIHKVFKEEK